MAKCSKKSSVTAGDNFLKIPLYWEPGRLEAKEQTVSKAEQKRGKKEKKRHPDEDDRI